MSDQVNPALTPEEWAAKKRKGGDIAIIPMKECVLHEHYDENGAWNSLTFKGDAGVVSVNRPDMHAVAALALHGQPFGFTREDVQDCRDAGDAATSGKAYPDELWGRMNNLAARIEALLPPEEK